MAWCASIVAVGSQLLLVLDELLYSFGVQNPLEFFLGGFSLVTVCDWNL